MRDLDRYQADYETLPFEAVQAAYRRRHVIEGLDRFGGGDVLEVGCGSDALFLHYKAYRSMLVVEPAERFHASALAAAQGRAGVSVLLGGLQQVAPQLAQRNFDRIVISSLLHEIPEPSALLACAFDLCSERSTVHAYVPNARSFHRLLALEMGLIQDVHDVSATQARMQQSATYDRDSLTALLSAAGFEVIESGSFFIKPFTHAQMAGLRDSGLLSDAMLDGLYGLSRHLPDAGSELYAIARRKT